MTEREQSSLNFSIEESVWLKKGQEVGELYTVELNPDVTIEERDDQVFIKGNLCMTGEYRPSGQSNDVESDEANNQLTYRSFSQLSDSADEVMQFEHRFPVDITIPQNRIRSIDDLYVTVDNFDYELPSPSCLEVMASVSVSGIYEKQSEPASQEYETQAHQVDEAADYSDEDNAFSDGPSNPFPILEFESRRRPEKMEEPKHEENQMESREPSVEFASRSESRYEPPKAYSSHFMRDQNQPQFSNEYEEEEHYEMNDEDEYEYDYYEYEEDEREEEYVEEEHSYEQEEQAEPQKTQRQENALYLTKMLTREDEALTKLKMCIIQAGDSLDKIAGKYEVPTSQLVRVNRLESEEVEEGQILYIPVPASR